MSTGAKLLALFFCLSFGFAVSSCVHAELERTVVLETPSFVEFPDFNYSNYTQQEQININNTLTWWYYWNMGQLDQAFEVVSDSLVWAIPPFLANATGFPPFFNKTQLQTFMQHVRDTYFSTLEVNVNISSLFAHGSNVAYRASSLGVPLAKGYPDYACTYVYYHVFDENGLFSYVLEQVDSICTLKLFPPPPSA
eukprot:TRINITY_DN10021_c0_g1_i1.p2 TRINITY_DN10021_c0_g1~~TRINITY_DN10021_c0_g1_i1.p2  ORF type:complete len:222 (-),score=41.74 TRINITY_DN10021_c0_g1_i1:922-1506(-)